MPLLRLRVTDESTEFLIGLTNWIAEDDIKGFPNIVYLCVEEHSQKYKKHIHIVVETHNTSTFRQHILEKFPKLKGNGTYSISEAEKDLATNLRYIAKGPDPYTDPVYHYASISHEEIKQYQKAYYEHNPHVIATIKELEENEQSSKGTPLQKKKKAPTWMEKITEEFINQYPTHQSVIDPSGNYLGHVPYNQFTYDKKSMTIITKYVLKKLGKSRKILDQFVVKRMCLGLLNAITDGEDEIVFESMFTSSFPDL